jgi:meso-butanediol dehydrogenase/(S,S)-butanediol dehydrogenase/diacetyl reductase
MRLADHVMLITGAGSGIGRATAELCATEGASVAVVDRDLVGAQETVAHIADRGGSAAAIQADVTNSAAVQSMVENAIATFGRIDILVNNAGMSEGNDILTIDEATWDHTVAVNLKGVYLCAKAVLPGMLERGRGSIVNISSVNGMAGLGEEPYAAAKAGMINLTKNMAVKYGSRGVRANVIAPGTIRTPIWNERFAKEPNIMEKLTAWYPLGRVGRPDDVAKAVLFLASDDAAWITGAVLPVDGGLMAGSYRMAQELGAE